MAAAAAVAAALGACGDEDIGGLQRAPGSEPASTRAAAADIAECLTGAGFEARRDNSGNPLKAESTALRATPIGDPESRVIVYVFESPHALRVREADLSSEHELFEVAGKVGLGAPTAARRVTEEIEGSGCLE